MERLLSGEAAMIDAEGADWREGGVDSGGREERTTHPEGKTIDT
jgi:hypothetical protein